MRSQRFSKARRVRRRAEYQRAFDSGIRVQTRYFTLVVAPSSGPGARLGIVASRKLGDAVRRNRAKRLIREIFRTSEASSRLDVDLVVIPRRELFDASYSSLENELGAALRRVAARHPARVR